MYSIYIHHYTILTKFAIINFLSYSVILNYKKYSINSPLDNIWDVIYYLRLSEYIEVVVNIGDILDIGIVWYLNI